MSEEKLNWSYYTCVNCGDVGANAHMMSEQAKLQLCDKCFADPKRVNPGELKRRIRRRINSSPLPNVDDILDEARADFPTNKQALEKAFEMKIRRDKWGSFASAWLNKERDKWFKKYFGSGE